MPLSLTHALIPVAGAVAAARKPIPGRLLVAAMIVAIIPDLDGLWKHAPGLGDQSIWSHRGVTHSMFVALLFGILAAFFHRRLRVLPLTAGVVVAAAMASHGLLDMMTDSGRPVAYLWPLTSARLFADWRPIPGSGLHPADIPPLQEIMRRALIEMRQVIAPLFGVALTIRLIVSLSDRVKRRKGTD